MVLAAIAAEYNPFHNGHARHIAKTRAAGATHIAAIMSGNYTRRGTPALAEKRARAHAALLGGADLVLELPLPYAIAEAERFAFGAVGVAEAMGCVDLLSFGSESGYLALIEAAAGAVDAPAVRERMGEHLATGVSFARARHAAVSELCGDEVGDRLTTPADALAVELVRQLRIIKSKITPLAFRREDGLSTSAELRECIGAEGFEAAYGQMPEESLAALLLAEREGEAPFDGQKLELPMLAVLRRIPLSELTALPDLSEGMEDDLSAAIREAVTLRDVYDLMSARRYPAARVRRVILSAFLRLDGGLCKRPTPYLRVLGFNERGREVLSAMRNTARLPVSDALSYLRSLGGAAARFAEAEALSTDLYRLGLPNRLPCGYDDTADSVRLIGE